MNNLKGVRQLAVTSLAILVVLSLQLSWALAQTSRASIIDIEVPGEVNPGASFTVSFTVSYTFTAPTEIYSGLWDMEAATWIISEQETLVGEGTQTYSFELTAPAEETTWALEASAWYSMEGEWVHDEADYFEIFEVSVARERAATYTLTVTSTYGTTTGGGTFTEGTIATFAITPTQVELEGERHTFTGWTSTSRYGYTGTGSRASVVMQGNVRERAEWETECYLSVISEVPVEGAGWYADGSTVELNLKSPRGFLIRKVFNKWSGDVYSRDPSVSVVMTGARSVVAEWSTNYSQAYLVGGVSAALIVGGGYVTVRRRRKEKETQAAFERRRSDAQAVAELRRRILEFVMGSGDVVVLGDVAGGLNVSEGEVKAVIEEEVRGGVLVGRFSNDGRTFITDEVVRRRIEDRLGIDRKR